MIESAGIFIFDLNGELLVCVPKGGLKPSKGYTIPKGKLDDNETPEHAALRETLEECGLDLFKRKHKLEYIGKKNYTHKRKRLHGFVYYLNCRHDEIQYECKMTDEYGRPEIEDFHFIPISRINELHPVQKELLEEWYAKSKNWD